MHQLIASAKVKKKRDLAMLRIRDLKERNKREKVSSIQKRITYDDKSTTNEYAKLATLINRAN